MHKPLKWMNGPPDQIKLSTTSPVKCYSADLTLVAFFVTIPPSFCVFSFCYVVNNTEINCPLKSFNVLCSIQKKMVFPTKKFVLVFWLVEFFCDLVVVMVTVIGSFGWAYTIMNCPSCGVLHHHCHCHLWTVLLSTYLVIETSYHACVCLYVPNICIWNI